MARFGLRDGVGRRDGAFANCAARTPLGGLGLCDVLARDRRIRNGLGPSGRGFCGRFVGGPSDGARAASRGRRLAELRGFPRGLRLQCRRHGMADPETRSGRVAGRWAVGRILSGLHRGVLERSHSFEGS